MVLKAYIARSIYALACSAPAVTMFCVHVHWLWSLSAGLVGFHVFIDSDIKKV